MEPRLIGGEHPSARGLVEGLSRRNGAPPIGGEHCN